MPSGLLRNTNVIYYHPLDSFVEHVKGVDWTGSISNFVPGIFGASGLGILPAGNPFLTTDVSPDYSDVIGVDHFVVAFWSSGFFTNDSEVKHAVANFGISSDHDRNFIALRKTSTSGYQPRINLSINFTSSDTFVPLYPMDDGLHFVVIDVKYESASNGWQHNISIDGSGWQDLGINGHDGTIVQNDEFRIEGANASSLVLDEFVAWSGHVIFTDQELSNLYELGNTFNKPMNEYAGTFPTPVSGNIDCFTHGREQASGNISLYIPGQKETKSTDLFIKGSLPISGNIDLYMSGSPTIASGSIDLYLKVLTPTSGNISLYTVGPLSVSGNVDNFIQGSQIFSDSTDQYVYGHDTTSGNFDLYVSGVPALSSSVDLYIAGPLQTSGNFDDIITGHLSASGSFSLFMRSGLDIDAFVAVVDNNPSNTVDLSVHGIPFGASPSFYINDTITLFISNDGSSVELQSTWSAFMAVDAAIPVASSGIWQSFLRGGNTTNNNIDLYINSHASGEAPRGILTSGLFTAFIEGKSIQDGDEGLLSNGYYAKSFEASSFVKVHLGVNDTLNFYVSGEMAIIPPSSTLNLFTFGILGIPSGSHALYIPGKELVNGSYDLFVFGIQGIESGNIPLYIRVTTLGPFNKEFDLYTHGF